MGLIASGGDPELVERLGGFRAEGLPEGGAGARMLEAVVAFGWAFTGRPAPECAALALRSLADGVLAEVDEGLLLPGAIITLSLADRPEALAEWDRVLVVAHRRGSLVLTLTAHMWRGYELLRRGELAEAERSVRESLSEIVLWGSGDAIATYSQGLLVTTLVERGDLAAAAAVLAGAGTAPAGSQAHRILLVGTIELRLADGRAEEALAAAQELMRVAGEDVNPAWVPVHTLLARSLAAAGRREEARAVAEAGRVRAVAWGAASTLGRTLRVLGELEGGPAGLARLQEAAAVLAGSHARLERARTLAALGAAQRDAGDVPAARAALAEALELAEVCGAVGLAAGLRDALRAAGGAPLAAVAGAPALTDAERRVADLAGTGLDPRAIAQQLHLTPPEVAGHLDRVHAKRGR
jgi:DNA-binding CsgD family transcriptional regulator